MPHRNARRGPEFTVRLEKAHEEIHAAFVRAIKERRCSQTQAADGMGVNVDTVRNYVHKRTPVSVARVIAFPRLRKAFLQSLCTEHHEPVGYVARKSKRRAG